MPVFCSVSTGGDRVVRGWFPIRTALPARGALCPVASTRPHHKLVNLTRGNQIVRAIGLCHPGAN